MVNERGAEALNDRDTKSNLCMSTDSSPPPGAQSLAYKTTDCTILTKWHSTERTVREISGHMHHDQLARGLFVAITGTGVSLKECLY